MKNQDRKAIARKRNLLELIQTALKSLAEWELDKLTNDTRKAQDEIEAGTEVLNAAMKRIDQIIQAQLDAQGQYIDMGSLISKLPEVTTLNNLS